MLIPEEFYATFSSFLLSLNGNPARSGVIGIFKQHLLTFLISVMHPFKLSIFSSIFIILVRLQSGSIWDVELSWVASERRYLQKDSLLGKLMDSLNEGYLENFLSQDILPLRARDKGFFCDDVIRDVFQSRFLVLGFEINDIGLSTYLKIYYITM